MQRKGIWENWYGRKLGIVEPEIPKILTYITKEFNKRVLDLGCGIGRHLQYLAESGVDAFGLDIAKGALEKARDLLHGRGLSAHLLLSDMSNPFPFKSGLFDAVVATRVIHHAKLADILEIVREIDRVLVQGGLVFIQSSAWTEGEPVENPNAVEIEPRTLVWPEGEEANVPHHFFTKEELLNMFKNYEPIELHSKTDHYGGWCFLAQKTRTLPA